MLYKEAAMFARSYLFVPGHKEKMLQKSLQCHADALVWDLEDAVPDICKKEAREIILANLRSLDNDAPSIWVRINNYRSKHFEWDLEALYPNLTGLILPKVESSKEIKLIEERLQIFEKDFRLPEGQVKLHASLETARGVWNALEIAESSTRMQGISLGAEDFTLDIGTERSRDGAELMYARGRIVLAAAVVGIAVVDTVFSDFQDKEGLKLESQLSYQLGFNGKFAIHPSQLPIIHRAFHPTPSQIAFAKKIHEASEQDEDQLGVFQIDGKMIDLPIVLKARELLRRAEIGRGKCNV
jgi:citrate lyase subunit beta/citryl-CoA lyase